MLKVRSSRSKVFCKKGVFKKFRKITSKTPVPESLFQHSCRAQAYNFIKKEFLAQVFSMNFAKFLRTPFLTEYIWRLLLKSVKTACVGNVFLFHYFKYYGQNIFSRTTVLYLTAKVERKEWTLFKTWNYLVSERKEKQNFSG